MQLRNLLLGTALATLGVIGAANAHTIQISGITGSWQNGVPPANVTYTGNGTANPEARWGVPAGGNGQSGYNFSAAGTINTVIPPSPTPQFTLGTFQHVNEPIDAGTSITGIQLAIHANLSIDGGAAFGANFLFDFSHDETTNSLNPCPYGGANGQGVNINGCADRVSVNYNSLSDTFTVGTDTYTLNLFGFEIGGNQVSQFLTVEDAINTASLEGVIELRSQAIGTVGVPEPASMALIGAGILGLGIVRSRSRKKTAEGEVA
jgi:hypothetical protein